MAVGADGVISVASNIVPKEVSQMVRAFAAGDLKAALKIHGRFFPLFRNLFIETNPAPIKAALAMKGLIEEEYRLPMVPMAAKNRAVLEKTLKECGVLK
jgi:4-hydroxy-tetrahydrodipicolinate synthase